MNESFYLSLALAVSVSLLVHATVKRARLERAYKELYKVNRINLKRLEKSAEIPF
jgi:hypothetical protein